MKINEKENYFTRYLKKKQQQFNALKNNKKPYTQSIGIINSNSQSKKQKREVCLNIQLNDFNHNKQRLNHKKTISTPIDLFTPKQPNINLVKYPREEDDNIKDESNDNLLNFPLPNQLTRLTDIMPFKHIKIVEKKVHDLLNIIEVFEKENNLNYEPFKTFFYQGDSNTERYANNINNKKYISPPNSARFNKPITNLSLSSKESTHYLSKKINSQINNNLNEAISKTFLDESNNNTDYQFKSYSMKKVKHNYPKLIGLKQNIVMPRASGGIFNQENTMNYRKSKEYVNKSKVFLYLYFHINYIIVDDI